MKAYDRFKELCEKHNKAPTRVGIEAGVARSTISEWGKGLYTPKVDKLYKLANYFGVPVTEFIEDANNG